MSTRRTFTRRYLELLLAAAAAWYAVSEWLGPVVVRQAWADEGPFGFLSRWLPGRELHPVASYLETWERLSLEATAAFVPVAVAVYLAAQVVRALRDEARSSDEAVRGGGIAAGEGGGSLLAGETLTLALLVGLGAGLLEGYYVAVRAFLLDQSVPDLLYVSQDSVWMAPLVDASLLLLLGLVLVLAGTLWRRAARTDVVVGVLGAAGLVVATMPPQRIHLWACALFAAGVGVQAGCAAARRREELVAGARRWTTVLVGVWLAAFLVVRHQERIGGSGASASQAGSIADPERPNVVLVVLDTERASELGLYGYRRNTSPELDRIARGAIVFERAIAPSPWTLPSHWSLFTGLLPSRTGFRRHHRLDPDSPTLAERLSAVGYRTGGFVGNIGNCSDFWGFDIGFDTYRDQPLSVAMAIESSWAARELAHRVRKDLLGDHQKLVRKTAEDVNREFFAWRDAIGDATYFAFLNYFDAHEPYLPPAPFDERFTRGRDDLYWLARGSDATRYRAGELQELQASYDNGVAYADHALGRLVRELHRRGDAERTWLVVTSDHGEHFGEHGLLDHDNSLYMPLLHVPLVILPPKGRRSETIRVDGPVSLVDVPATILDLVGEAVPAPGLPGASLMRLATRAGEDSRSSQPDTIVSEWRRSRSLVVGDLHYIRRESGEEELYDLSSEEGAAGDLSDHPGYESALAGFRSYLRGRGLLPGSTSP